MSILEMEEWVMQFGRIVRLADELEREIRRQRFRPGDPYPDTEEVARRLGVSTSAANGALRVLAKRGVLDRRQRRGTIVARLPDGVAGSALRRVHLLVHREYLQMEGLLGDGLLIGIQGELPGVEMQFNFIPTVEAAEYANGLITEILKSREGEGVVLVRAPLPIQRAVRASGLPAVVLGSLQPSVEGLPWIDRDQGQIGELAGEYLLKRKCRRIVALFRAEMGAGDASTLDRLQGVCDASGLGLSGFTLRCLSADREAIAACVRLLLLGKKRRTGFFCRSQPLADGVVAAAESLGLMVGRDVEVVVSDVYLKAGMLAPKLPYVRPLMGAEETGHRVGRMLAQQARGEPVKPGCEVIPVELVRPR
jgi:hypothetical protein